MSTIFFNAHHAPQGAFSTFTLGCRGASGGLGTELSKPADQNFYIGLEQAEKNIFEAFPFYALTADERARYETNPHSPNPSAQAVMIPFPDEAIHREFKLSTDTWRAGDLAFTIYSPLQPIPDPVLGLKDELETALLPAVGVEITVDNTRVNKPRKAFFGYMGSDPYTAMRHVKNGTSDRTPFQAIGQGRHTLIASQDETIYSGLAFTMEELLTLENPDLYRFGLGGLGGLIMQVEPGEKKTFRFAVCFYRGGFITAGLDAVNFYTRFFSDIEAVAKYALDHFEALKLAALASDAEWESSPLSWEQKFMLAHAVRSYTGSTQLLAEGDTPLWIVNEGEYRMINTLDLAVDHLFYEMRMHPWTVRNVLDRYAKDYRYYDQVRFPGDSVEHPGGLSFTHDMGVANVFSRPNFSAYECHGLKGCFSHMTHEQLLNWLLSASVYAEGAQDQSWLKTNLPLLKEGLQSLLHRDHPHAEQRNGIMGLDSSRTGLGAEITTYDCEGLSLKQARNSLYLAVKAWAAYVVLEKAFKHFQCPREAEEAGKQSERCAATILRHQLPDNYLPAILPENGETINTAKIIPAIEGLVFPLFAGCSDALDFNGRFKNLLNALRQHLKTILVPGACLFEDGGWKLTTEDDNSWPSKIYLTQFISRRILGIDWDEQGKKADHAHLSWFLHPKSLYWGWSDQMLNGAAVGARYYPRGVTSILWLYER
jgi:hypothetical protein